MVEWWVVGGGVGTPPSRPQTTHHTSVVKCDEGWCGVLWCAVVCFGVLWCDASSKVSPRSKRNDTPAPFCFDVGL